MPTRWGTHLGGSDPTEQLAHFLKPRELLLVLDNFEHLLESVNLLCDLLLAAPHLKMLVTSREVLNLRAEWVFPVEGLSFPPQDHGESIDHFDAVRLFVNRARHVRRDFALPNERDAVAQICRLLDGSPLGIELAASWLTTLSSAEIAAEIQRGLDFLTTSLHDMPERHRSIRAVFDQSWQRLTADEQRVLAKLTVFRGGCRRDAAVEVAGADLSTLSSLVAQSMLYLRESGRYDLHELLRQYAEARLHEAPEEEQAAHDLHCAYYAQSLSEIEPQLKGKGYLEALDAIQEEIDNVRAAWRWAVTHDRQDDIQRSMHSIMLFFQIRARVQRAMIFSRWPRSACARQKQCFSARSSCSRDGSLIFWAATWILVYGCQKECLFCKPAEGWIRCRSAESILHYYAEQPAEQASLRDLYHQNLTTYRARADRWGAAWTLMALGMLERRAKQYATAYACLQESTALIARWVIAGR